MFTKSKIDREQFLAYGLLGLLFFAPLYQGGSPYPALTVLRLGVLFLTACTVLSFIRTGFLELPRSRFYPIIFIFMLFVIGTTLASPYKNVSIEWTITLAMYLLFFGLTLSLFQTKEMITRGLTLFLLLGAIEALLGIVQYGVLGQERATGTFFNPNYLGGFLVPLIAIALSCLLTDDRGFWNEVSVSLGIRSSRGFYLSVLLGLLLMVIGLILTGSRGAMMAFFIAAGITLIIRFGKRGALTLSIFLLVFLHIPNPALERFIDSTSNDIYAYSRKNIWKSTGQIILDHPLGVGFGMFQYYWPRYNFPVENALARYGRWSHTPHNEYLQVAVELGIGALIVFLTGLLLYVRDIWKTFQEKSLGIYKPVLLGLGSGFVGTLVHGFVDSNFHEPSIGLQFAFISGLMLCIKKMALPHEAVQVRSPFSTENIPRFYPFSVWVVTVLLSFILIRPLVAYGYSHFGSRALTGGDVERSIRSYNLATWWNPGKTQYHSSLAAALFRKFIDTNEVDWVNESTFELNYAKYLNPKNEEFPRRLGYVYSIIAMRTSETETREYLFSVSLYFYKQAIKLNPYQPNNYQEVGKIYSYIGDFQSAEKSFLQAKAIEPNFLPARLSLGDIYAREGKIQEAQQEYMRILSTLKIYSNVTGLTPLEKQFLNIDHERLNGFSHRLNGRTQTG